MLSFKFSLPSLLTFLWLVGFMVAIPKESFAQKGSKDFIDQFSFDAEPVTWHPLVESLKDENLQLKELLEKKCNQWEDYNLEDHNFLFLKQIKENLPFIPHPLPSYVNSFDAFFFAIIVLHDLGKVIDYEKQLDLTAPLLEDYLLAWNFSPEEMALAKELVLHDLFGLYAKQKLTMKDLLEHIYLKSEITGLSPLDFFYLQKLFYLSDMGSYRWLRENFMDNHQGYWDLKSRKLDEIEIELQCHLNR